MVLPLWVVENRPFPLLWPLAYTTACTTVQAMIGKYLGMCQKFSAKKRLGGTGPLNVNLGPPIISETTGARKFKLKTPLDVVKYPLWIQKLLYYTIQHEGGRHIDFRQTSVSPRQTTANNCKTAFSLHVVKSASDD